MINCKRCKYKNKVFGVLICQQTGITGYAAPCSIQNYDGNCTYYEAKFPYNLWKRCIECLLPKKRVYYSGNSQDNRKRDPNKPYDNTYGHHWGKRRHLGYAVCDWCNAVENTDESVTRCPMAELAKLNGEAIWVRVDKFGYHSIGYGKFGSGSVYFEYPEPSYAPFPKEQE